MSSSYFSPDYASARDRFCQAATEAGARLDELTLKARGPQQEKLTINLAWLGAENPDRVLLHTSGVHGVEGFTGSAIQLQLLQRPPELSESDALVVVHGINPYGMAWGRRFNENNVDLNRNFLTAGEPFEGAPEGYRLLNALLNPESPPRKWDMFYPRLVGFILRYGFNNLKQAIAGGQYHYRRGLFFGGHQLEEGPALLLDWFKGHFHGVKRIGAIDIHTGLGKYGIDSLLVSYGSDTEIFNTLRDRLGDRITPQGPSGVAYLIQGLFIEALEREIPDADWTCMVQEFGTYPGLPMLNALRQENRWHHFGRKDQLDHPVKQQLLRRFSPNDVTWQNQILKRGKELIDNMAALVLDR
ncbi:MAG: DUF2817 domain-containing protein [Acidobacteriota bacterium]